LAYFLPSGNSQLAEDEAMDTVKSENRKLATIESDNRKRLLVLQTLSTCDFDELAEAFLLWNLCFRQFGRGPF
jgi:hypothetical protein